MLNPGFIAVVPVWRVRFDACEIDADQFGASHFNAMSVWRVTFFGAYSSLTRGSSARFASLARCSFFTFSLHAHTIDTAQEMNNVEM